MLGNLQFLVSKIIYGSELISKNCYFLSVLIKSTDPQFTEFHKSMLCPWTGSEWESQRFSFEVLEVFSHHSDWFSILVLQFLLPFHENLLWGWSQICPVNANLKCFLSWLSVAIKGIWQNVTYTWTTPSNRHVKVLLHNTACRDIRCLPAFSQEASGERRNKSQAFRPRARPSVWSPTLLLFWTFQFKSKNIIALMPPRMLAW